MKKVLITGSTGFIGKKLKEKLLKQKYEVVEMSTSIGDITDISTFNNINLESISHIFHLAAKTFVPDSWIDTARFYDVNIMGTVNILEYCRKFDINLTFISAYLYGQPNVLPIIEEHIPKPNNPYGHSKYLAEQVCQFYSQEFQVKTTIIRPFNVFGIGQNSDFLIPHIINQAIYEKEIRVKDLIPKRDYIYIDDLIDAIIKTQMLEKNFSVYNIGSGHSVSVKEIIDIIQNILNIKKPVICENSIRRNEINDVVADISKAKIELNWFPKYSFKKGLKQIIDFERMRVHASTKCTN